MIDVIFIGLSLGSILLLVALGLAITYGAMGVINMAHGDLVMVGAYTTVMSGIWLHLGFLASIPVAFVVTALIGFAIERLIVRRLYGRLLDTLLATWGVAILLQQAVRLEFGAVVLRHTYRGARPGPAEGERAGLDDRRRSRIGVDINIYRAFIIVVTLLLTADDLVHHVPHRRSASRCAPSCATRRWRRPAASTSSASTRSPSPTDRAWPASPAS